MKEIKAKFKAAASRFHWWFIGAAAAVLAVVFYLAGRRDRSSAAIDARDRKLRDVVKKSVQRDDKALVELEKKVERGEATIQELEDEKKRVDDEVGEALSRVDSASLSELADMHKDFLRRGPGVPRGD